MLDSPSWLLLLWTGLAASLVAATVIAPIAGPDGPRGTLLFFRPKDAKGLLLLILLGLLIYPAIYGLIFDALHIANIFAGAVLGFTHGLLLLAVQRMRREQATRPGLTFLIYVAYGAVLGFLYVTP